MKRTLTIFISALIAAGPAFAHEEVSFTKPEDAVKYRQSTFNVMATHFSRIGAVVKGEKPFDKTMVERDAAIVEMIAQLPWSAFPANSNLSNSKAKPAIWKEQEKFNAAAEKMQAETAKLSAAAKTGDLTAIKAAFGGVGQSCKACHDNFKSK